MSEKYWIGDLCYVIEDWSDFCDKTIDGHSILNGDVILSNGTRVSHHTTAFGDGCYLDQFGNEYDVDAGLIGIIKLSDVTNESGIQFGHIFEFEQMPSVEYYDGTITFGHVNIETDPPYEEDEEDNYYNEDEE